MRGNRDLLLPGGRMDLRQLVFRSVGNGIQVPAHVALPDRCARNDHSWLRRPRGIRRSGRKGLEGSIHSDQYLRDLLPRQWTLLSAILVLPSGKNGRAAEQNGDRRDCQVCGSSHSVQSRARVQFQGRHLLQFRRVRKQHRHLSSAQLCGSYCRKSGR